MRMTFIQIISLCFAIYALSQTLVIVYGSESDVYSNYLWPCERCDSGTKCLLRDQVCDGHPDCDFGDENNCSKCTPDQWACNNSQCIDLELRCNGFVDCKDRSDEDNCTCTPHVQWKCNQSQCIRNEDRCDGVTNCLDMSDEFNCSGHCRGWSCENSQCIHNSSRCNGLKNCKDGSDEENCIECSESALFCNNPNPICISKYNRCDGVNDCGDNRDELNCEKCKPGLIQCNNSQCIDDVFRCNGQDDCVDGSDEANCDNCFCDAFSCGNKRCIDISKRCDGIIDCEDERDEKNCPSCSAGAWKCSNGRCIQEVQRCNGEVHCEDQSDEKRCDNCSNTGFRCSDGTCISLEHRCDGHHNCEDKKDEKDCDKCIARSEKCINISCVNITAPSDDFKYCLFFEKKLPELCSFCSNDTWLCANGECIQASERCDGDNDCLDGSDEKNCGCTDNPSSFYKNMACSQLGSNAWFHCLNEKVNKTCCRTCQDALIGLRVHPREQCKYLKGCNATFSRVHEPDIDLNINPSSICTSMPCRDISDVTVIPSLTGTPCGFKKVCKNSVCTPEEKGKNVPDTCVFGDDPDFSHDNFKCDELTVYQQQNCYRKDVKQNCCFKCREFDHNLHRYDVAALPGEKQTLQQQCEDVINGQLCSDELTPIGQVCTSLPCKGPGNLSCEFYIAAAGTDCGDDRMCISEQCVSKNYYRITVEVVYMKYIFYASLAVLIVFLIAAAYVLVRYHRKYNICLYFRGRRSGSYSAYQDIDHYDFLDDNEVDNVVPVLSNKASSEDIGPECLPRKTGENQNANETDELGELYNDAESTAVIAALRNPISTDDLSLGSKEGKLDHPYDHLMNAKIGIYPSDRLSNEYSPLVSHSLPAVETTGTVMDGHEGLEEKTSETELESDKCWSQTQDDGPTQDNGQIQDNCPAQDNGQAQDNGPTTQDNCPTQDNSPTTQDNGPTTQDNCPTQDNSPTTQDNSPEQDNGPEQDNSPEQDNGPEQDSATN